MGDMVHELMKEKGIYNIIVQKIFSDKSIILEEIINYGKQETKKERLMDKSLKIDIGLKVRNTDGLKKTIYIQEHSRSKQAWKYNDITITGKNRFAGAEFERTAAQYMIYIVTNAETKNGKIIKPPTKIIKLTVVNLSLLDSAIMGKKISYQKKGNFKNQYMFAVPVEEIRKINALNFYWKAGEKKREVS